MASDKNFRIFKSNRAIRILGSMLLVLLVAHCNLLRSSGKAQFAPSGKPGMGRLSITGPSGWECIQFEKTRTDLSSNELGMAGKGRGKCPLFGAFNFDSTSYPTSGKDTELVADQPTLVYQNEAKTFEIYALITKDKEALTKLDKR
jgi:hypothetical protein